MPTVCCADCGTRIELPEGTHSGDVVECPSCAGHLLRAHESAGGWFTSIAYRASCPACAQIMTLPADVRPGDTVRCCGRIFRLTFEYGSYAAEAD